MAGDDWSDFLDEQPTPNLDGIVTGASGEAVDLYEIAVAAEMDKQRARRDAKRRLDAEETPPVILPAAKRLDVLLAEPDPEQSYRVDRLAPAGARIMLNAQWKAGKSTLSANLIRALVDGEPFLGQFAVHHRADHLVLIDDELAEDTLRLWMREQKITTTEAVEVFALRGKLSSFNLLD